ncbi:deoxyguanosinetriphosphate triphosphohydrolase [Beijerinckia indica]|uniref:Deoxyguanosinetriphosphate triphosphohydrolase-like protein n=1 Tax=Beijerinckia indica subsp. indica (strain ATCC 9039 / DSM 1715 / NCIMB 8712) TaxID=395963 RepID=B2IJH0_BEII9|nr:deoxyguanosinetriphosphate triphosphohydrolase [Beijerinckia indica]ACB96283.1 deoxyguanosinetriphosphate triphosphohydrolase [Beijerinckia indica subsp. indica ATCC 9039]
MQAFDLNPVRAPYAANAAKSRGRLVEEPASPSRTDFQRDRDRIIHSAAFRRLAHKTQVFVPHEGDHYRTRLTHSIEVGQIARALARALGLDDDLAEALALAHDLGHTPFGHTGEDVLDAIMLPYGGFDHNAQALRIVTKLERRYAAFDGLNLTFETLEGLVKHNGPLLEADGTPVPRYAKRGLPMALIAFDAVHRLDLSTFASAEAQAAALADDIAYNAHDIDDGLRAGILTFQQISEVDFLRDIGSEIETLYPGLEPVRVIHELVRRLITHCIEDAIDESRRRIMASGVTSIEDVRAQKSPLVGFSQATQSVDKMIKSFLFQNLYRHPRLNAMRDSAAEVISRLFPRFFDAPEEMPPEWAEAARRAGSDEAKRARVVCDYIAGMTDRFAINEHRRLFDTAPDFSA